MDGLKNYISNNEYLIMPKFSGQSTFGVKHSASQVTYETSEFVSKNKNDMPSSVQNFMNNVDSKINHILNDYRACIAG
jgi:myosin heavy subunit